MDPSEIEFGQKLGVGASAKVFMGVYRNTQVAIKLFKTLDDEQVDEFKKEMQIFSSISKSPYLVAWYGAALAHGKLCMVMDLCSRGSLHDVMTHVQNFALDWKRVSTLVFMVGHQLEQANDYGFGGAASSQDRSSRFQEP